ncbi:MAG: hypothetical protein ACRD4U_02620 [Candidatus Acidiferrales bacterium]
MRLEMEKGEALVNPDAEALERALRSVDGWDNCFARLEAENSENDFLQAMGGPDEFTIEYQEAGRLFRRDPVRLETVIALFQSYRRGDDWWRRGLIWKEVTELEQK